MASFAVDITEVRFAATNTGYKDITITGMPQAGVSCTITGADINSFGYRIPGSDQNVYRVYTTSNVNIGSTSALNKTATFRITNAADSTDYVDVSLVQVSYFGYPVVRGVENVYDNIYAYYRSDTYPDSYIFAEYRTDAVGTYAILYVDGYEGTTTLSQNWAYYTAESAYTDTGFKQIKIGATNNYDSAFRSCTITFPGTSTGYNTQVLYQNAYPSNTAGCTSPTLFTKDGGTEDVYTYHSTGPAVANFSYENYTNDGLTYTIRKYAVLQTPEPKYRIRWETTVGPNSTDNILRGALLFYRPSNNNILGFTLVRQDAASGPAQTLTADPAVLDYPASGGGRTLDVTYATSLSTNESSFPSWLSSTYVSVGSSARSYTITAASNNTSVARSFNFELADVNMSLTVPITQASGTAASLSVSPSSDTVSYPSGSVQVTVTSSGISDLNYTISDSWITSAGAPVGGVYTFNYTEKNSVGQRTGTITFYGGGLSETYTLIQNGMTQLTVSPPSELVGNTTGSVYPEVTGASNISYSISQDARSWLSYRSKVGDIFTFDYTTNESSTARTGVVTFSATGYISNTYTLTQSGASAMSADPNPLIINKNGGESIDLIVTGTGVVHLNASNVPDWIDVRVGPGGHYYIDADANSTGYVRQWNAYFYDNISNITVPVIQYGTSSISLSVSPSSGTVDVNSGTKNISVTAVGISSSDINYRITGMTGNWLTYRERLGSTFYFNYAANDTGSSRSANITFYAFNQSATYTLTQEGGVPPGPTPTESGSLKAYPKKLRYYKEGGSINVSFTSRPVAGIGYQITYTDGSGWLTVSNSGSYKTVTAAANSGIRRRASIKFYDFGDSTNYVILPVIQGSVDGYDSIWVDQLFYPQDRDENGNYYYRLVNQDEGYEYFVGVSTEPQGSGNIGIDIPRLVEGHLWTDFETRGTGLGWNDMQWSYFTIDVYNMTDSGWPGVVDGTFKYCNDWSRIEKRYDYTRSLNDPINFKGTDNMFIPFCVYYDDSATFSIVDTEKNGSVNTYTFTSPSSPFAMRYDSFYDTKRVDYRQDGDILFSYDMTHCGPGAFIYRNRFGGWDSFLIEGNVIKTDNYTKQNWRRKGFYNNGINENLGYGPKEKITDSVDINTTYEAYTGWLTDEESARLVYHLLSSPTVYYQILNPEEINTDEQLNIIPIRLTASSAEYKKFRNGKRLVNYLITFEKGNTEKVMR